jgi:hypothetical protein
MLDIITERAENSLSYGNKFCRHLKILEIEIGNKRGTAWYRNLISINVNKVHTETIFHCYAMALQKKRF